MPKKSQSQINDVQQEINLAVAGHLEVANKEMGVIQEKITSIESTLGRHIPWVEKTFDLWEKRWDKLENRIWWILGVIVIGFLANLYFK